MRQTTCDSTLPAMWAVFAHAPMGCALLDAQGVILAANDAFSSLLEVADQSLIGQRLADFAEPSALWSAVPEASTHEVRYCRSDGSSVRVSQVCWPVLDAGGVLAGHVVQLHETDTRPKREWPQAKHLDLLTRYADALPGMAAYWNSDLRCEFANGAYLEWFGKRPTEMPGIPMQTLLGERLFALNKPYIDGALRGELQQFERTLTKANGETGYTWAQYVPDITDDGVRGFFVLVSDITHLKQAQNALIETNKALEQRTREAEDANRSKTHFLSMVSHELRSPLHTILGYTDLLLRQSDGTTNSRLKVVHHSGKRLLRLIDDILEFNLGQGGALAIHPAPLFLPGFCDQIANAGALLARRRHNRFNIELDLQTPQTIEIDEQRLNQIVSNLVENACKFTQHGEIQVHIRASQRKRQRVLHVSVTDNGPGIAKQEQTRIFDAFMRSPAHQHQPGIGLGLAIVQQIVHAMGGDIRLRSSLGKGSCFEVFLPLLTSNPAQSEYRAGTARTITGYRGPKRTLLVADDMEENRHLLEAILETWGFRVVSATSGNEGIAACQREDLAIDAALVDQFMTDGSGWDFLKAMRKRAKRSMPILLISAQAPKRPAGVPAHLQFDETLQKPVSIETLANVLARQLNLEWESDAAQPARLSTPRMDVVRPSPRALKPAHAMLALGQILAIEEWADSLCRKKPEYKAFAQEVLRLCGSVDLRGLEKLLGASPSA